MKKFSLLFMALLTLGVTARAADGDEFTVNNLKYKVISEKAQTAELTGYDKENFNVAELAISQIVKNGNSRYAVTRIGNSAFSMCTSLTSVTIPNSVTEIGKDSFYNCNSLTSVTIPNSVTKIGNNSFYNCRLTSVTIPNSVTEIGFSAFSSCSSLDEILVEDGNIGYSSENGVLFNFDKTVLIQCPGAKESYVIPNSVTKIEKSAFAWGRLTSVTIPNSVTEIGNSAFLACYSLTSVTIPNSVTKIEELTFNGCRRLTSVTIPNSVTEIGSSAFNGCRSLTSVTIPNSVTEIGNSAFHGCRSLTSVTIPNSVTEIGNMAFLSCESLEEILVENGNRSYSSADGVLFNFDKTVLIQCPGAKESYVIPNSVTKIGDHAFGSCSRLTSVTIPNSVTEIGNQAFDGCYGLTSVKIPQSMTKIGDKAFQYCKNLSNIYSYAPNPPALGSNVFNGVNSEAILHVIKGADAAYKEAEVWKEFFVIADLEPQPDAGIEGIDADGSNAPAEYFNLNGVRVANPEKGLYIKRRGGNAEKVLVK